MLKALVFDIDGSIMPQGGPIDPIIYDRRYNKTMKIAILFLGLILGYIFSRKEKAMGIFADVVFKWMLPYVVIAEVSSHSLAEGWYFLFGSGFVIALFYLSRLLGWDKHKSALLATAEGGTMGFVLYSAIGTQPLSWFFIIDMLGNGAVLFSFIYWQVGNQFKIVDFAKNRLMIAMVIGVLLNVFGWHALSLPLLNTIEPGIVLILTALICIVVGSKIHLPTSKNIFVSWDYWKFWLIRLAGLAICLVLKAPLALSVLFVLPPSFLLPVIYQKGKQHEEEKYASNFIAACLPIALVLAVCLFILEK